MTNSIETLNAKIATQAARIEQLTAESVALKNAATSAMNTIMQSIYEYWEDRCHINHAFQEILNVETPATDAALREIQAQAIIKAARFTLESVNEELREAVRDALGEAMDCTRVWSAWSYGTMSESDFVQVADDDERVEEIVCAVVEVIKSKLQAGEVQL